MLEPNICPNVLIHMFWPGAQTGLEKNPQQYNVLTGSLNASNTSHKDTERNTCTNAHMHKKAAHMRTHTVMLPKQIRSDASACACQEHAECMLQRERERGGLGERQYVCTRCDMPASACQDLTVPMPSAKAHIKEKWDTSSRKSKWEGYYGEIRLFTFSLCMCVCFHWETLSNTVAGARAC